MLIFKSEQAQGLVEYALILLFVAIVVILIIAIFGSSVGNLFSKVISSFPE